MVDLLAVGASVLELAPPKHRRLETTNQLQLGVTGPESNAAVVASRLGADCVWGSKLPATPLGRRVVGDIRRHGVETAVCWDGGRQGLAFAERAGDPRGEVRVHDRDGAVASMTPDELPLSAYSPSMVYVSGATAALSETLAETTKTVFEELARAGTTTVLSLSRPRAIESPAAREAVEPLVSVADVLVTTEAGAAALCDRTNPTELAHALASTRDFETVVLARGERGALVWHDTTVYEHTPPATETADDRGAFDALCGGFLARRLAGESPDRALAAAVACAALARTISGSVSTLTREEVERCVRAMESSESE